MDLKNFLNFTYLLHLDWSFDLSNGVSHWQNSPYLEEKNVWWVPFLVLPKRLMSRIVGVTCSGKSLNNKTRIGNKQGSILRDYIQRKQLFVIDLSYFCRSCPLITIIIPWWLFKPHPSLNPFPPPPPLQKKQQQLSGKKPSITLKKWLEEDFDDSVLTSLCYNHIVHRQTFHFLRYTWCCFPPVQVTKGYVHRVQC